MKITVWVPGPTIVSEIDKLISREEKVIAEINECIDKAIGRPDPETGVRKTPLVHHPDGEAHASVLETCISERRESIASLELHKKFLLLTEQPVQVEFEQ